MARPHGWQVNPEPVHGALLRGPIPVVSAAHAMLFAGRIARNRLASSALLLRHCVPQLQRAHQVMQSQTAGPQKDH